MLSWNLLLVLATYHQLANALYCTHMVVLGRWGANSWEYWRPGDKLAKLAETYCENFMSIYEQNNMDVDLKRYGNGDACRSSIMPYFADIYYDQDDIKDMNRLALSCVAAQLSEMECTNLVHYLKPFCWTMLGISDYIELVKDSDVDLRNLPSQSEVFIDYDMYMAMRLADGLDIDECMKSGHMNTSQDIAVITSYILIYKAVLAFRRFPVGINCNCREALAITDFCSKFKPSTSDDMATVTTGLLQGICTIHQKTHRWSEMQLAYMIQDDTLRSVKRYTRTAMTLFFRDAGLIAASRWHQQSDGDDWTLDQVMQELGLESTNQVYVPRMQMVQTAIDMSMPHSIYVQYLTILATVPGGKDYWRCMDNLFAAIFPKQYQDSDNHWSKHLDQFIDHVNQLMKIATDNEKSNCSGLVSYLKYMEAIYYVTKQWNVVIINGMLNAAFDNNRSLTYTAQCFKLISIIESRITMVDFTANGLELYNADMINRRLDAFRHNIFAKPTEFCSHDVSEYTSNVQLMVSTFFVTDETVIFPSPSPSPST